MGWPGPLTHRQFLTWVAWRRLERNATTPDQWYQIQTTQAVLRQHAKDPKAVTMKSLQLDFDAAAKAALSEAEKDQRSREAWMALAGYTGQGVRVSGW